MKKLGLLASLVLLAIACSPRKDAFINRTYQSFTSYYNTLFHGKEALKSELEAKKKSYKEDFYSGYIEVFPQNSISVDTASTTASQFFGGVGQEDTNVANNFQKAEQKALKIIENKSMVFGGEEKNKEIFNAYLLLAESRIYQGKLFEALDALNQIYFTMSKDKRIPLAKIYEGLIHSKMRNHLRAEEIFLALDRDSNLKKEYRKLLSIYYAENLLRFGKKEEAIEQLTAAMELNKSREIRSRIAYLKGQVLADLNRKEEARESFAEAYRYSNNFEFEVKSQIEIAKTFTSGDSYEEAKNYLEKISKKGTYTSRKNELYYALGLLANEAGNKEEAQEFFTKSIREKISDQNIRGLAYFEIGKSYLEKEDYIRAGAYYDSALVAMEHQPMKEKLTEISANIKNIAKHYYLVKKNDSILALTQMSDIQRRDFFTRQIEILKEKEAKQLAEAKEKEKRNKREERIDFSNNINFTSFGNGFDTPKSSQFYFSNVETIAKGSLEFKKIWGDRVLGDNWRESRTNQVTLNEIENKTLGRENTADSRRFEVEYYTEKIPTSRDEILNLKKERDAASLELGRMYEAYFQNTNLATKTLYDLVDNNPESEIKLQALYLIFSMNFEKNQKDAHRAKELILKDFPYTPYAEFVKNPRRITSTELTEGAKDTYQKAYALFSDEKLEEAKSVVNKAIKQYPKDALLPKFELLNAFITGKTVGKEIMALQLQQIVFNYEKTEEGAKAKEVLGKLNPDNFTEQIKMDSPIKDEKPVVDNMVRELEIQNKEEEKSRTDVEEDSNWET